MTSRHLSISLLTRLSQISVSTATSRAPLLKTSTNFGRLAFSQVQSGGYVSVRYFSKGEVKEPKIPKEIDPLVEDLSAPPPFQAIPSVDDDPFGLHFEDGAKGLGPEESLPPMYKRDAATGRMTGEIKNELSEEKKRILKADPLEQESLLLHRLERHWEKSGVDASGQPTELNKLGERIRRSDMGLNVLGRSVRAQTEVSDDGEKLHDGSGFSKHLSKSEFESFSAFMKQKYKTPIDDDEIPMEAGGNRRDSKFSLGEDPDSAELSLKWLTTRAQRQMDDSLDDDPFSDLMPGDLSPPRLVNRKRAKRIPPKLLHHNNIPFLLRYTTPTAQIKNRVQTRLGAREQRRVAKLIRRARSLGLMPYVGQMKAETHGWVHETGIREEKEWEKELKRRGLVIKRSHSNAARESENGNF